MKSLVFSYSNKDRPVRDFLERSLDPLIRKNIIRVWSDAHLLAGQDWQSVINSEFGRADIYVIILSNNYLGSEFSMRREAPFAMERAASGQALLVPVLWRDCSWRRLGFDKYQIIPSDCSALSSLATASDATHIFADEIALALEPRTTEIGMRDKITARLAGMTRSDGNGGEASPQWVKTLAAGAAGAAAVALWGPSTSANPSEPAPAGPVPVTLQDGQIADSSGYDETLPDQDGTSESWSDLPSDPLPLDPMPLDPLASDTTTASGDDPDDGLG